MKGIGRKRSEASGNPQSAIQNIAGVESLFSGFNNQEINGGKEAIAMNPEPLLSLDIEDDALRALTLQWIREYDDYYSKIKSRQEDNYDYWKGKQKGSEGTDSRGTDNIIFESTETLLPIISRQNPEPTVEADNTQEGDFLSECTAEILAKKSDDTRLKSKLKTVARHWCLYFLGCMKMGWDEKTNDLFYQVIDPLKLILDPKGFFDGGEFNGRYLGEKKSATAEELCGEFPKFKDDITSFVGSKMGTVLNYTEWWTNEYVFWQFNTVILDKRKNPYWNGDTQTQTMDQMGVAGVQSVPGVNHFASAKLPYAFFSVFNTGKQPHDETSLIEQTKPLQDIVNKRLRQIDKNADETNNGWVLNSQFSQDQGKQAVAAMKTGGAIIAPTERISDSVMRLAAPNLAQYVYQDMQDKREQIYNIMGVRGSTAQGVISEQTVRGKIQIKGQDVDRLSLIVEQLEQLVDHLYNLAVQTMYVYYTAENTVRALGKEKGDIYIQMLKNGPSRRLTVSVKEGSTIPQDPLTKRNEAIDLWNAKAIDPETLFERLDFPDPKDTTKKLLEFMLNPQMLLQEVGGAPPQPAPVPGQPSMPGNPPSVEAVPPPQPSPNALPPIPPQ